MVLSLANCPSMAVIASTSAGLFRSAPAAAADAVSSAAALVAAAQQSDFLEMCMTIYPDESNFCNACAARFDRSMIGLHVAAIDHQVLTGDIAGVLRAQIRTETRHFLRPPEAVCRNALEEVRHELLVV